MEAHEEHQEKLVKAFAAVISAERQISQIASERDALNAPLNERARQAEVLLAEAWVVIRGLLDESGEVSAVLPGEVTDYEIYRTAARESVKVVDPEAVPEAFCKVERKPKLKEIGDYLRAQARASLPLPNWAALELGESKLAWRAKKKHATT